MPPAAGDGRLDPSADGAAPLREAADRLESLAARTTGGDWRLGGLLASRPEVVAHGPGGRTEHVAEARTGSGAWITALSPALSGPLAGWLRAAAAGDPSPEAAAVARVLLDRLPDPGRHRRARGVGDGDAAPAPRPPGPPRR